MHALILAIALGQFLPTGMESMPKKKASSCTSPGSLFTDTAGTVSHVYFTGTARADTKSLSWTQTGTVPQNAALSCKVPPSSGPYSASNYYQLGTGSDVLDFAVAFTHCFAFTPSAAGTEVGFSNGSCGLSKGYYWQTSGTNQITVVGSGCSITTTTNTAATSGVSVACIGWDGAHLLAKLNTGAIASTSVAAWTADTGTPARIGVNSGAAIPWTGVIFEEWWSTDAPSDTAFTSIINSALAKVQ